eukprot:SAG31_NODE_28958_length_403_cov_0.592105_1_plen_42_part_10
MDFHVVDDLLHKGAVRRCLGVARSRSLPGCLVRSESDLFELD